MKKARQNELFSVRVIVIFARSSVLQLC